MQKAENLGESYGDKHRDAGKEKNLIFGQTFTVSLQICNLHASIISPPLETMLGPEMLRTPCTVSSKPRFNSLQEFHLYKYKRNPKNPLIISRWNDNPPALPPSMGSPSPASPPPRPRSRGGGAGRLQRRRGEPSSSSFVFAVFAGSLFGFKRTLYQGILTAIKVTVPFLGL